MGETITITANDGFSFSAYQALPEGTPKASVLIIQEIFGVNQHIKEVCDGYAESGFAAIAPAIFDRVETNVMLGYNEEGFEKGRVLAREKLNISDTIKDLSAAAKLLEQYGKPAAIGYCFGGFLAFAAATEIPELSCAVSYYGAGIATYPKQTPLVPVLFHFSDNDPGIPMSDVDTIAAQFPDLAVHVYPAQHGFNCNLRDAYHKDSADLALERTLAFLGENQ